MAGLVLVRPPVVFLLEPIHRIPWQLVPNRGVEEAAEEKLEAGKAADLRST